MKNHFVNILMMLVLLLNSCSKEHHKVRSISWIRVDENDELPYKLEFFERNGTIVYDSTLFVSGQGYRVNHYYGGRVISSFARFYPNISESFENEYDSVNDLVRSVVKTDRDTSNFLYKNVYNKSHNLAEVSMYLEGDTIPVSIERRSYRDSLLSSESIFKLNGGSFDLVTKKSCGYDERNRIVFMVIKDYKQISTDSSSINYKELEKKTYRSVRGEQYEIISIEKILRSDSSEIEFLNPVDGKTFLIKRKDIKYW